MKRAVLTFALFAAISPGFAQTLAWVKGADVSNQPGVYGTIGTPAVANTPGARGWLVSWADASGNFWIFGGDGYGSTGAGNLNDLWKYDVPSGTWTWMKGSNTPGKFGVYGLRGVPNAANTPGARFSPTSWTDASGNLWLFGGDGNGAGSNGYLNDLWKYDTSSGNWSWVKGNSGVDQLGVYGTQGVAAATNTPGGRDAALGWADTGGNLWLFGGTGFPASGSPGRLNDLWKYNIASGNWTWMSGSNVTAQSGSHGTMGVASSSNMVGTHAGGATWMDATGNLWLFGGSGFSATVFGYLSDLWRYRVSSGIWTWMKGSDVAGAPAVYGSPGVGAPANTPGADTGPISFTDAAGNFWLFGGYGQTANAEGFLSDLWKYDVGANTWAWMRGTAAVNQPGTYGTIGNATTGNRPGARVVGTGQRGPANTLLLFGGAYWTDTQDDYYNDVWTIYLNASVPGPPRITGVVVSGSASVDVTYSEAMKSSALLPSNYVVSGSGRGTLATQPSSVKWVSGNTYRLSWITGSRSGNGITVTTPSTLADATGELIGAGNVASTKTAADGWEMLW
jgi:hypothetical protein